MPILATGTSSKEPAISYFAAAMNSRRRIGGFSLIEILVVVVIVAIVTSMALLSIGLLGDDRELRTEARRLVSLVEVAQDEAMMQGREFGLELMTNSYRFVEYEPLLNQWNELLGDDTLRLRQLPEDVEFALFLEDKRILLEPEPDDFDASDEHRNQTLTENYAPHILIFSSGDMTPFELRIMRQIGDQVVVLRSDVTGAMEFVDEDT